MKATTSPRISFSKSHHFGGWRVSVDGILIWVSVTKTLDGWSAQGVTPDTAHQTATGSTRHAAAKSWISTHA